MLLPGIPSPAKPKTERPRATDAVRDETGRLPHQATEGGGKPEREDNTMIVAMELKSQQRRRNAGAMFQTSSLRGPRRRRDRTISMEEDRISTSRANRRQLQANRLRMAENLPQCPAR